MTTMQGSTSSIKAKWVVHMEKTESHYLEDTSAVECGKKDLEEVLHNWYERHPWSYNESATMNSFLSSFPELDWNKIVQFEED